MSLPRMKIGIIGSRIFKNEFDALELFDYIISFLNKEYEIVSGGCKEGIDFWVKAEYDNATFPHYKEFPPEFDKYPIPQCYHIRNNQIINYCDLIIAIWNGNKIHSGTYSVITKCKKRNKPILVFIVT